MLISEDERFLEERQMELTTFLLRGREFSGTDEDMKIWRDARAMLCAPQLLETCEYALGILDIMSSEQFTKGGDRPARLRLAEAIAAAKGRSPRSPDLERRCAVDIKVAIEQNATSTL